MKIITEPKKEEDDFEARVYVKEEKVILELDSPTSNDEFEFTAQEAYDLAVALRDVAFKLAKEKEQKLQARTDNEEFEKVFQFFMSQMK